MWSTPLEIWDAFKKVTTATGKIVENNIKYRKACIAYNQAILDMMEAVNDNTKLMKGK